MKNYIITISREFGCGARDIGISLASKLDIPLYDKELVDLTAQMAGLNLDVMRGLDEVMNKKQNGLFQEFGYGSSTSFYSEKAIQAQAQVIRDLANRQESCIMFGRCADYILREHPNVLNLFLYAPLQARIKHIADVYDLDLKSAEKLIKIVDKQRHNYYKYVTGHNRGDRNGKEVMIDVCAFGSEKSVDLMYQAVKIRFDLDVTSR